MELHEWLANGLLIAAGLHGVAALVTAFAQDPRRGEVAEHAVGVTRHPCAAAVLPRDREGVVDDHLAAERDQGQRPTWARLASSIACAPDVCRAPPNFSQYLAAFSNTLGRKEKGMFSCNGEGKREE